MFRLAASVLACALASAPVSAETLRVPAGHDTTLVEHPDGALGNGAGPTMFAGRTNQADNGVRRALVSFDFPSAFASARPVRVEKVALLLTVLPGNDGSRELRLHRVLTPWGEGTSSSGGGSGAPATVGDATWVHTFHASSFWPHNGGHFEGVPSARVVISDPGVYRIESERLTRDVALWAAKPGTNFGWVLIGDETQRQTVRAFATREFPDALYRPVLEITFSAGD